MKLRIPFWATFYTVIALIIFIGLGISQVKKFHWKQNILDHLRIEYAVDASKVSIDPSIDLSTDIIKKGFLKGRFLHDKAILIQSRTYKGYQGYHLITPFEMVDLNNRVVFVNRGWVPLGMSIMDNAINKPEGLIMITGYLRQSSNDNNFVPDNIPDKNQWYSINPEEIAKAKGIDSFYNNVFYKSFRRVERVNNNLPIPVSTYVNINNNHAGYALFWFLMAIVLFVIYMLKFITPQYIKQFK